VIFAVWLVIKAVVWALRQVVTHWRTSLTMLAVVPWCRGAVVPWCRGAVVPWCRGAVVPWWHWWHWWHWWGGASLVRPKLPDWLHACGLSITPGAMPMVVTTAGLDDTLTQVTAEAWRLPRGDSVHVSVTGLLPGGASVWIYGGLWATHRGLGADLAPNATTIPLAALRHAATIEEMRT
jgi:hypothetical protein